MPLPPRSLRDLGWPVARLTTVYGGRRAPVPGAGRLPRPGRRSAPGRSGGGPRDLAWLLLGPILATFGAAALHVYPFEPRLVLFLFPAFLLLTAAGPGGGRDGSPGPLRRWRDGAPSGSRRWRAPRSPLFGLVRDPPPYAPEPLKPVLVGDAPGLAARRPRLRLLRRGEGVRLLRAALRLRAGAYVLGALRPRGPAPLPARARRGSGGRPRVWLVVAHAALGERRDPPSSYLDRIGTRRASYQATGRAPGSRRTRPRPRRPLRPLGPRAAGGRHRGRASRCRRRPSGGRAAAWSCHPGA